MKKIISLVLILLLLFLVGCDKQGEENTAEKQAFAAYSDARTALLGHNENCYTDAILIFYSVDSGEQFYRITTERLGNDAVSEITKSNEIAESNLNMVYKDGVLYSQLVIGETESKTAAAYDKDDFFKNYTVSPAGLLPDLAESDFAGTALKAADEGTLDESDEFGKDARILSLTLKPAQVTGILSAVEMQDKTASMSDLKCEMVFAADGKLTMLLVQGSLTETNGSSLFAITVGFDNVGSVKAVSLPEDAESYK